MSTPSLILFYVAVALLVAAIVVPGWDTSRLPKRAVKRRIYWAATVIAIPLLFVAGLPDLQSAVAFVAMAVVLMVGWAYFRTPNITVGGVVRSADPSHRGPDPTPPGDRS
jgi:hypothetical protein